MDNNEFSIINKGIEKAIVGLAGTALGATTGDVATTVQSVQVAQNAVENNFLSVKEAARKSALIYNL
ncbi:VENN motif pre-toxin domain-containing protein [Acinetobacter soli]|uniref:VENN motif pre-toxin domain-containing protein n=1 Tax=Acinetobacter soli TaxID=487316 RepID=UPI001F2A552C|nr:VENN motif pre-toxin domain-containing protein [Acinetobacter soli]MCE6007211.1 VENN motif pre-toxin domain-containing protein [Acinetobacter soli]